MGLPMALQLEAHGFKVNGFDVRPVAEFAGFKDSMLRELLIDSSDTVLFLVVRDAQQCRDVCFEDQAVFNQAVYPGTLVVSSTVSPSLVNELRERLPDDVALVDAPMSGAAYSAEDGTLTFMVGGPEPVVQQLMPAFNAMGSTVHYIGESGQGMLTKVLNNYVAASTVVAVRRSLRRAADSGLDIRRLLDVMQSSSGATWFGSNLDRIAWHAETYTPQNTIGILEKDVTCSLDIDSVETDDFDEALLSALRILPDYP